MEQPNFIRGNIIKSEGTIASGLFLVAGNEKGKYEVIDLKSNKRVFVDVKSLESTSLLIAHEYTLHTKKKLQKLLKAIK